MSFEALNTTTQKATTSAADVNVLSAQNDFAQKKNERNTSNKKGINIQPKLTVGAPDDPYEREADSVADKVMRMPEQDFIQQKPGEDDDKKVQLKRNAGTNFIQRKCEECEKEEKIHRKPLSQVITPFIQTKSDGAGSVSDSMSSSIENSRGSGSALDGSTQSFMENRMGADFSKVKIHTGSESVQMNRELNAQAFTVGNNVYFNQGKFEPHNEEGKKLLAHELTHVVQQTSSLVSVQNKRIQCKTNADPATQNKNISVSDTSAVETHAIQKKPDAKTASRQLQLQSFSINKYDNYTNAATAMRSAGSFSDHYISRKTLGMHHSDVIQQSGRGPPQNSILFTPYTSATKASGNSLTIASGYFMPGQTGAALNSINATESGSNMRSGEEVVASATGGALPQRQKNDNFHPTASRKHPDTGKTKGTTNNKPNTSKPLTDSSAVANGQNSSVNNSDITTADNEKKNKTGEEKSPTGKDIAQSITTEEPALLQTGGTKKKAVQKIELLMPEPSAELNPASQKRIRHSQHNASKSASIHSDLPAPGINVADARGSVDEPKEEVSAKAGDELVAALGERPPPSPEILELCEKIRCVIKCKRPPDEDSLVDADPEESAKEAGGGVKQSIDSKVEDVDTSYEKLQQTPQGEKEGDAVKVVSPEEKVNAPGINATNSVPDAVPAENISLDADVASTDQQIKDAGMTSEPAQLVQDGPIAEARNAHAELGETAVSDPAAVEKAQQEILAKAGEDMNLLQSKALHGLMNSRSGTIQGVSSQQKGMKETEEAKRARVGKEAEDKFIATQKIVNEILGGLSAGAMKKWDAGVHNASVNFKNTLKQVKNWIDDRHSGVGGTILSIGDYFTGLPGWVTDDYNEAEKQFGDDVCELITNISAEVNAIIASCQAMIEKAHEDITNCFKLEFGELDEWAIAELGKFDKKFKGLQDKVNDTKNQFNKDLAGKAAKSVQDVRDEIHALREKAKGLIGRIADAIAEFIDDPVKFIIEGLLNILGIPIPAFWRLVNKIKTVIGQIADDPVTFGNNLMEALGQGFNLFIDNFTTHLKEGFIAWLTSGFGAVGVQLPPDFSVPSMITFFLQLMGISWERIRKLVAKHIGEENVEHIEKAFTLIADLVKKGPEGIIDFIKDMFNPETLLSQIIDAVVDFVVKLVVERVAIELLKLFNPVGAILKAIEAIYGVFKWIFENAAKIFTLVETVVNGIADIISGNIGGMAKTIEKALTMLIAPIIDFLAELIGLGDLPNQVASLIKGFQNWVDGILDRAITWLANQAKKLLKKVGIGKEEEQVAEAGKPEDTEVGKVVHFTAGGESHKLWVNTSGSMATVMMASDKPAPLTEKVTEMKAQLPEENKAKGEQLGSKIDTSKKVIEKDAAASREEIKKAQAEGHTAKDNATAKAADDIVEKEEDQLPVPLVELINLVGKPPIPEMDVNPKPSSAMAEGLLQVRYLYNDKNNHGKGDGSDGKGDLHGAFTEIIDLGLKRSWDRAHLLNDGFGGTAHNSNLIPMLKQLNIGPYKDFDRGIRTIYSNKKVIWIDFMIKRNHENDPKMIFVSNLTGKAGEMIPKNNSYEVGSTTVTMNFGPDKMIRPAPVQKSKLPLNEVIKSQPTDRDTIRAAAKSNGISERLIRALIERKVTYEHIDEIISYVESRADWKEGKNNRSVRMLRDIAYALDHNQLTLN